MLIWVIILFILAFLTFENIMLRKIKNKIPVRIHIYGTRGKTMVSRTLYDSFHKIGVRVVGKTTGDIPLLLHPDGSESIIKRYGPARIQEYVSCLRLAFQEDCKVVVFECMAITPETIISARNILSPTHVLITNTRPDHHETLGNTPEDIANSISLCINSNSKTIAIEDDYSNLLRQKAEITCSDFVGIECAKNTLTPLINAVAKNFNFTTESIKENELPKLLKYYHPEIGSFLFLDLFSANDVVSSEIILHSELSKIKNNIRVNKHLPPVISLLSTRKDRPLRTSTFINWMMGTSYFSGHYAVGGHTLYAYCRILKYPISLSQLFNILPYSPLYLLKRMRKCYGEGFILVGLGNTHGYGNQFRHFISKEATLCY